MSIKIKKLSSYSIKRRLIKTAGVCVVSASVILLTGCAATETMISKHNLDVQTKMSQTVFLNPVTDKQKTVYVQMKNTSDQPNFDITHQVDTALSEKGYRIVHSLSQAHYLLQANILQIGKVDPSAAQKALFGGYGSALSGAGIGIAATALATESTGTELIAGGLIGGVASTVADSLVKDVTYSVITDVQISERAGKGVQVNQKTHTVMAEGSNTAIEQSSSGSTDWIRYRTRILSTAEKVNLSFNDAKPALKAGLVQALSGIF